ncbi:YcbK family protein [Candidatus Odyssella acanthamoebae]|uniref:YcbK family protein n=1 Tax=Candidatus Odyssella acanthamoebae TaxID=91604 RepID=UPI0018DCF314|nr:DUF882 domain-containing protein [Candidatus Paracaedibacter acanthamoebae]
MENFIAQQDSQVLDTSLSRRQLIKKMGGLGLLMVAPPLLALSSGAFASVPEKSLNIYNTHTGESLKKCIFWLDGKLNREAMTDLNRLFRDHRTNQEFTMDPNLMHLIHNIWEKIGSREMVHLISGYRSPKTNAILRQKSCGVASNSQHLSGKAADIMVPGRTMKQVQQAAKSLKAGGVGRYANFVHVDTGRVRYWGPA